MRGIYTLWCGCLVCFSPLPYAKLYLRNPSASLLRETNQFLPYETEVSSLWH